MGDLEIGVVSISQRNGFLSEEFDIFIIVILQLVQNLEQIRFNRIFSRAHLRPDVFFSDLYDCLGNVHSNVWNLILPHLLENWDKVLLNSIRSDNLRKFSHAKQSGQSVQVVRLYLQLNHFL